MNRIAPLPKERLTEFVELMAAAYPGMRMHMPEDRARFLERSQRRLADPRTHPYGAFRGDTLVGGMMMYDYSMNFRGVMLEAGGLGSVAVALQHKKEHIAKDLVSFYLEHYRAKNAPLAVLWPFRPDFYLAMGFGMGTKVHHYRMATSHLPASGDKTKVRQLSRGDAPQMCDCYQRSVARITGMIADKPALFENQFDLLPGFYAYGYFENGRIDGFLSFQFEPASQKNWLENDIKIQDFVYQSSEALRGLLAFLHSQRDQIGLVMITTSDDQFHLVSSDMRDDSGGFLPPVYHQSNVCGVGVMYRVVDTVALLEQARQASFGPGTLLLELQVTDSFLPKSRHSGLIRFADGRMTPAASGRPDVTLRGAVQYWSALLFGATTVRALVDYGHIEVSDPSAIADLDRLFHLEPKAICLTRF